MKELMRNGLDQMFDDLLPFAKRFGKNTYEGDFAEKAAEYQALFAMMRQEYDDTEEKDQFVQEVAVVLPGRLQTELDKENSKRKRDGLILQYNMGMTTLVLPLFYYMKEDFFHEIAVETVKKWNKNGSELRLEPVTYEKIQEGFKHNLCYITTAVCRSLGKGDSCPELNTLRRFRDEDLLADPEGKELVKRYYDIAPTIVNRINKSVNADEIYQNIWDQYLKACVSMLEEGKKTACKETYCDLMINLEKKYLLS